MYDVNFIFITRMDFIRKRFRAVGLKGIFRKKKKTKFEVCVDKVIEARRSGCIDDEGNIIQPAVKTLTSSKDKELKRSKHAYYKELEKQMVHQRTKKRPPSCTSHDSYPLPQEDDGSEGYASASELENFEFNPTVYLERNRAAGLPNNCIPSRYDLKSTNSARKVRFSDDVCRISSYSVASSCGDSTTTDDDNSSLNFWNEGTIEKRLRESNLSSSDAPDRSSLSLDEKISYFNEVISYESQLSLNEIGCSAVAVRKRRGYQTGSGSLRSKVLMFERLSRGGHCRSAGTFPRRELHIGETRAKIRFFETLEKCNRKNP